MRLSRLSLAGFVLSAIGATAAFGSNGFHSLISLDSRNCYSDALSDVSHNRVQQGLAKLESLAMDGRITVGIDASTLPAECPAYKEAVNRGIGIWCGSLKDCPFAKATGHRPMVLVKFVKEIPEEGGDLQGLIEAEHLFRWGGGTHSASLTSTMYVVYRLDDRYLTRDEVSEVVAHELGHLLGLTDAIAAKGLMGPFVPGSPRLLPSPAELEAVTTFRQTVRAQISRVEKTL